MVAPNTDTRLCHQEIEVKSRLCDTLECQTSLQGHDGSATNGYSARNRVKMKKEIKSIFKSFSIELVVYAALVLAYFFLVLHFLGGWLYHLFQHERKTYAFVALGLIIGQGIILEILTRALLRLVRLNERD
jgi:hypothetical protein